MQYSRRWVLFVLCLLLAGTFAPEATVFAKKNSRPTGGNRKYPGGVALPPGVKWVPPQVYGFKLPGQRNGRYGGQKLNGAAGRQIESHMVAEQRKLASKYLQAIKQQMPKWQKRAGDLQKQLPKLKSEVDAARSKEESASDARVELERKLAQGKRDTLQSDGPAVTAADLNDLKDKLAEARRVETEAQKELTHRARALADVQSELKKINRSVASGKAAIPQLEKYLSNSEKYLKRTRTSRNRRGGRHGNNARPNRRNKR